MGSSLAYDVIFVRGAGVALPLLLLALAAASLGLWIKPAPAKPSLGALTLDPGDERTTRQSLLKVADMLTETGPDQPLGYQVRRYAIWQNITTVPPTRDGKRTDLAAVSADRVADYREALEKSADLSACVRDFFVFLPSFRMRLRSCSLASFRNRHSELAIFPNHPTA